MEKLFVCVMITLLAACDGGNNNNNNNNNNTCGDGVIGGTEVCDGDDLGGETCASKGFDGGALACASTCLRFVTSSCTGGNPVCGNGQIDDGEDCDGADFAGQSCPENTTGQLSCTAACRIDEAGCHADPLKVYASGTRMKMRVGVAVDGSRNFNGWYDTTIGMNCIFRKMADGVTRCLPELTAGSERWYSDPTCAIRLAAFPKEDAAIANGTLVSMEVSTGTFKVYTVISVRTTPPYMNSYGVCNEISLAQASAMNDLYAVYETVTDFQSVAESLE